MALPVNRGEFLCARNYCHLSGGIGATDSKVAILPISHSGGSHSGIRNAERQDVYTIPGLCWASRLFVCAAAVQVSISGRLCVDVCARQTRALRRFRTVGRWGGCNRLPCVVAAASAPAADSARLTELVKRLQTEAGAEPKSEKDAQAVADSLEDAFFERRRELLARIRGEQVDAQSTERAVEGQRKRRRRSDEESTAMLERRLATEMKDCAESGDLHRAFGLFDTAVQNGMKPTVATYGRIMSSFAAKGQAQATEAWFEKACSDSSVCVNLALFNALIRACVAAGDTARACFWFREMRNVKVAQGRQLRPNFVSYGELITGHVASGDVRSAEALMEEAIEDEVFLEIRTFTTLIAALGQAGDLNGAERWLERAAAIGHQPDVAAYNAVISACSTRGDLRGAMGWLEVMAIVGVQPDIVSYTSAIDACAARARGGQMARQLLDKAISANVQPNTLTYTAVLNGLRLDRDVQGAEAVIETMRSNGLICDVVAWTSLIETFAAARPKASEKAAAAFRAMVQEGVEPNTESLTALGGAMGAKRAAELVVELGVAGRTEFWKLWARAKAGRL